MRVKPSTIVAGTLRTVALSANSFTGRKSTSVSVVVSAERWKGSKWRCHMYKVGTEKGTQCTCDVDLTLQFLFLRCHSFRGTNEWYCLWTFFRVFIRRFSAEVIWSCNMLFTCSHNYILVCSRVMAYIKRPETSVLSTYIGTTVNRRLYSACFWPITKI